MFFQQTQTHNILSAVTVVNLTTEIAFHENRLPFCMNKLYLFKYNTVLTV